jgi:hypothetical protein
MSLNLLIRKRSQWEDNIKVDITDIGCGLNSSGLGGGLL